ncbi:MarR family winged helix-turn-helix transcriptional regulator [Pararhodospirillum photometricum]|uniref:Transcriptional regulator, MarR family n=1 Tax=Pararhodospirillum photometricum DSM 122 TaxID=1150469 RepID=H6SLC0_PARPM|nr:MarR family transcriptional regulator [Pararhodospirillum photometricum]CCG08785.1 Transcriptional regulator, MarR family [Pararhodospirillum photometricum DSM 122]
MTKPLPSFTSPENVGRYLSDASGRLTEALDRRARPLGITAAQWRVLIRICLNLETTAADLCRSLSYDSGSMTRMIDRLEGQGLIRRERSEEDRRVVRLALTEAGEALRPRLQEIGREILEHFLRDFTPDDVMLLMGLLQRLANAPPLPDERHGAGDSPPHP